MGVKLTETEKRFLLELRWMETARVQRSPTNIMERMGWSGYRGLTRLNVCLNRLEKLGFVTPNMRLALVMGPGVSRAGLRLLRKAA